MKISEVTKEKELRLGMTRNVYAVDEKGEYTTVPEGWESEIIMSCGLEEIAREKALVAGQKVLKGETSPIEYYMYLRLMGVGELAKAMGIAAWRVRRHLKPAVFKKMGEKMLQEYADVLKISRDDLVNFRGEIIED